MFTDPLTRHLPEDLDGNKRIRKSEDSTKRNASSDNLLDANVKSEPPPIPQRRSSSTDRNLSSDKFSSPRRIPLNLLTSTSPANDILRRHEHRHKELLKMQNEKAQILSDNKREEEESHWLQERISDLHNRRDLLEKELQQSSENSPSNERRLLQMDVEIDRLQKALFNRFGPPEEIEDRYRSRCDKVIYLEKQMLQLLKGGDEECLDSERIISMSSSSLMSESLTEQHVPASLCWSAISDQSSSPSHLTGSKLSAVSSRRFEHGQLYQNFDPGLPPQQKNLSHNNAHIGSLAWTSQSLTAGLEHDSLSPFSQHQILSNNAALPRPHTAPCSQSNSFIASQKNGNGLLLSSDITPNASGFIMSLSQDDTSSNLLTVLHNSGTASGKPPVKRSTAIKELREANYSYPPPHLLPPSNQMPLTNRQQILSANEIDLVNQIGEMSSDPILEEQHTKVLDFLHLLQTYCAQMAGDIEMQENEEVFPGPAVSALMKLSFDEDYRQLISTLGGLETIAEVLRVDYETFGHRIEQCQLTLRRHVCMTLTNLTFGVGANKSKLCSMEPALGALVAQLESPNEDLKQVAASVVRNLSWRAEPSTKQALRSVDTPRILTKSLLSINRESTLKSMLSALWNLSAHCAENKSEICAVTGALEFLVSTLTYKSPSKTLAIIENGGGILRNISSVIAMREEYRETLRERQCLPLLLRHLRSPSLTIVSNACGTLWNLSYRCQRDQEYLIDLGAVGMLRCLVNSKHKMISTGSAAALKNLLGVTHNGSGGGGGNYGQPVRRAFSAGDKSSLQARKLRALEEDVERILSEAGATSSSPAENINSGINTPSGSCHSNTGSPMLQHLINSSEVATTGSSESVRSANSDQERNQGATTQSLNSNRLQQILNSMNLSESPSSAYPLMATANHPDRLSSATSEDSIRHHNHEGDDVDDDCEDFARTYFTEGTPHLSTAPSVSQLATEMGDLSASLVAEHQHQLGGPAASCTPKKSVYQQSPSEQDYFSDSSEKPLDYSRRYKEQEDYTLSATPPPLPPKQSQSSRTSVGVVLPMMRSKQMTVTNNQSVQQEKPRIYAVEGTPVNCQSRTSSLSSIFEVEEPVSSCSDPNSSTATAQSLTPLPRANPTNQSNSAPASVHRLKQRHQQLERIDERSGSESREVPSGASKIMKTVTFNEDTRVHVDMTPLVFSRCSSYSSLESFEAESVHSSVASDYSSSRRTSEVVSPSELPDSPGDTMPQSRNKLTLTSASQRDEIKNRRSKLEEQAVQNREKDSSMGQGQRSQMKLLSGVPVAHDETKYFADEGTPLDTNSRKNSMDALHFYGLSSTLDEITGANILIDSSLTNPNDHNDDIKEDCDSGGNSQQRLRNGCSISTGSSRSSSAQSSDEDALLDPQAILQQCINSAMPPPSNPNMKKSPSEPSGGLRLHVQPPPGPLPVMSSFKPASSVHSGHSGKSESSGADPVNTNDIGSTGKSIGFTSQQSIAATNTPASSHRNSHSNTATSSGSNRNSQSTSSSAGMPLSSDFLMTYAVEGTPLNYSTKASSLSELSIDEDHPDTHSPRNTADKNLSSMIENLQNRSVSDQLNANSMMINQDDSIGEKRKSRATIDEESDTSSVNEECSELLSEVIQSAMPKRLPPSGSSGSAALSTRSAPIHKVTNNSTVQDNEPSTIIYPTLEPQDTIRVKQQPPKPPIRTASLISSTERVSTDSNESVSPGNMMEKAHGDTKSSFLPQTSRSTASNSVIDAPYTYQTEDTPAQHSRNSPVSHSLVNSPPLSMHRRPIGACANEEPSNRSSLSSLSIDSVGLEKTLLQECIFSAMPVPKSLRHSTQQSSKSVSPSSGSVATANSSLTSGKITSNVPQKSSNSSKVSSRGKQGYSSSVLLTSLLALQQQQQRNKTPQRPDSAISNKSALHKVSKSHSLLSKAPHNNPPKVLQPTQATPKISNLMNEEFVSDLARQQVAKEIRDAENKGIPSTSHLSRSVSQPTSPPLWANRKSRMPLPTNSGESSKPKCKETPLSALVGSTSPPPLFPSSHVASYNKPMETRSTPVTPRLARANIVSPSPAVSSSNHSAAVSNNITVKDKSRPSRSSSWFRSKNASSQQCSNNQKPQFNLEKPPLNEPNYKMVRSFSQDKDMSSRLFGFKRSPAAVPPDIGKSSSSLGAEANNSSSFVTQPYAGPPSVSSDAKTSSSTSFKKETGHFLDHCFGAGGPVLEAPKNDQKFMKQGSLLLTSGLVKSSNSSNEEDLAPLSFANLSGVHLDEMEVDDSDDSSLEIDCHAVAYKHESQIGKLSIYLNSEDCDVEDLASDDTDEETEWISEDIEDKNDSGIILEEEEEDHIPEFTQAHGDPSIVDLKCTLEDTQGMISAENVTLLPSDSFSLVSASLNSSITDAEIDFTSESAVPFSSESCGIADASGEDLKSSEDSTMIHESMSSSCDSLIEDIPNLPYDDGDSLIMVKEDESPHSPPPLPMIQITSDGHTLSEIQTTESKEEPDLIKDVIKDDKDLNLPVKRGPRIVKPNVVNGKPLQAAPKIIRGGQSSGRKITCSSGTVIQSPKSLTCKPFVPVKPSQAKPKSTNPISLSNTPTQKTTGSSFAKKLPVGKQSATKSSSSHLKVRTTNNGITKTTPSLTKSVNSKVNGPALSQSRKVSTPSSTTKPVVKSLGEPKPTPRYSHKPKPSPQIRPSVKQPVSSLTSNINNKPDTKVASPLAKETSTLESAGEDEESTGIWITREEVLPNSVKTSVSQKSSSVSSTSIDVFGSISRKSKPQNAVAPFYRSIADDSSNEKYELSETNDLVDSVFKKSINEYKPCDEAVITDCI